VSEWCRGIARAEDSIDELAEKLSNPKQKKTQRHAGAVVSVEDLEAPEEGSNRKRKLYEEDVGPGVAADTDLPSSSTPPHKRSSNLLQVSSIELKYVAAALLFVCSFLQLDNVPSHGVRYNNSAFGQNCQHCNVTQSGLAYKDPNNVFHYCPLCAKAHKGFEAVFTHTHEQLERMKNFVNMHLKDHFSNPQPLDEEAWLSKLSRTFSSVSQPQVEIIYSQSR